jgi:uncharacterized metal-binding protein
MADIKKIAEALVKMTASEVNGLAEVLKKEYGIEPACCEVVKVEKSVKKVKKYISRQAKPYVPRKIENRGYSSKKIHR